MNPARIAAVAPALVLASCGDQPPGGPPHVTEQERQFGAEQHPLLLAQFGGAYGGEKARYVATIGEHVADAAGLGGQ
jgi:predicted Zn-dependent protease